MAPEWTDRVRILEGPGGMSGGDAGKSRTWRRITLFSLVALLCVLPALLMLLDAALVTGAGQYQQEIFDAIVGDPFPAGPTYGLVRGVLAYSLLEWTAVLLAAATTTLAFAHFYVKRDVVSVVIGVAAFWMTTVTTFHLFVFHGYYLEVANLEQFVHFNWVVARSFTGLLLLGVAILALWEGDPRSPIGVGHLIVLALGTGLLAYLVIILTSQAPTLPDLERQGALIHRPLELVPMVLFILGALVVFPRLHEMCRSPFSLALWVSAIPLAAGQIYMAIGSQTLFDAGFTAAQLTRIFAYGIILSGLVWDYARACQRELELERRLRASDRRIRMLVENAVEAIVIFDGRRRIIRWNQRAAQLIGWQHEEVLGRDVLDILFAEQAREAAHDRARFLWHLESLQRADEQQNSSGPIQEATIRHKQGTPLAVEYSMVPSLEDGSSIFAVLMRDVSENKKLQMQMFQMDRLVAVGTLAAGVVHEIKNPLTYVINNLFLAKEATEELFEECVDQPRALGSLEEINTSLNAADEGIERVRHIIDDMRVFAHSEPGTLRPVSVSRAVELALRMTRGEVRRIARIQTSLEDTSPVLAEETRLSQVFVNLMTNAAQAMGKEPDKDHLLRIEVEQSQDEVIARFHDTGPGMGDKVRARVFEPFYTTKPAGEGTGLGLSLSRSIVEGFEGTIRVQSTPGEGATFEVCLPIIESGDGED